MRPRGELFATLPVDLLDEVAILSLAVVGRLDLRLAVEFDQQVAALDARPRLDEADNYQRAGTGAGAATGQARHDDRVAPNRLNRSLKPERRLPVCGQADTAGHNERADTGERHGMIDAKNGDSDGVTAKKRRRDVTDRVPDRSGRQR